MIDASYGALTRLDCIHSQTRVEVLPLGQPHHSQVVCVECGKHLCWKPHPSNAERRRKNAINLAKLLGSNRLTDWERGFCQGIQHHPRISPRQQALLDELAHKYLLKAEAKNEQSKRENRRHSEYALA